MKRYILFSLVLTLSLPLMAQKVVKKVERPDARITTLEKVTTEVKAVTTSSSEDHTDFPVYKYGSKKTLDFKDTYMILVRHDQRASDPELYLVVEVLDLNKKSSMYEMPKFLRVYGQTEEGRYSVKLNEVNAVLVLKKAY